ncbi:hypothetical protein [Parerythrobacter aestuarii]|uniref:hypothetical protein n=1 Tax=Parerythrobacter aestuarii TaxID=3020909 RepID=UPI0024DEB9BF|nr:hypothetical protein [Parerythrobacter aestuarii]
MKKLMIAAPVMAMLAIPAHALPENKPVNAAEQIRRDVCVVRGAEDQPYQFDNECDAKITNKRDKDGVLQFQIYRDKGTLQPGQEIDTAFNYREDVMIGPYECTIVETATPSGQYSSYRHCRLGD